MYNLGEKNNLFGETYGQGSKCFNHERLWTLEHCNRPVGLLHGGSGCYKVIHIHVHVYYKALAWAWFPCVTELKKIKVEEFQQMSVI